MGPIQGTGPNGPSQRSKFCRPQNTEGEVLQMVVLKTVKPPDDSPPGY